MSVTDHTRKVLWAFSRNTCARCGLQLVRAPEVATDRHAIVGQECHIVARSVDGPRGLAAADVADLDGLDNLILLCASCHAIVDSQPARYSVDELRALKAKHETHTEQTSERTQLPDFSDLRRRTAASRRSTSRSRTAMTSSGASHDETRSATPPTVQ